MDYGLALSIESILEKNHNQSIKLTKEQLNYTLLQNLQTVQTTKDIELLLNKGADIEVFKEYFLHVLYTSNNIIKICRLFDVAIKIENLKPIVINQQYLNDAFQKICDKKLDGYMGAYPYYIQNMDIFNEVDDSKIPSFIVLSPGNCISTKAGLVGFILFRYEQILSELSSEKLNLFIDHLIESRDLGGIIELSDKNILNIDNIKEKLKTQLINEGLPTSGSRNGVILRLLKKLNFTKKELDLGFINAMSKSQPTAFWWNKLTVAEDDPRDEI